MIEQSSTPFRYEVAAISCETCPLREVPEAYWAERARQDPHTMAEAIADQLFEARTGYRNLPPEMEWEYGVIESLNELQQSTLRFYDPTISDGFISEEEYRELYWDGEARYDTDPGEVAFCVPEVEHTLGSKALSGCLRRIIAGTCDTPRTQSRPTTPPDAADAILGRIRMDVPAAIETLREAAQEAPASSVAELTRRLHAAARTILSHQGFSIPDRDISDHPDSEEEAAYRLYLLRIADALETIQKLRAEEGPV